MAARQIVILALILFAVIGMASAAASDPAPKVEGAAAEVASASHGDGGDDHDVIGTTDGDDHDDAAPVGAPVSESTFPNLTPAPSPGSGASVLEVSGVAAVAAIATFFF